MALPILDLNQVSHNSANFQASSSKFGKVVNLEEETSTTVTMIMTTRTKKMTRTTRATRMTRESQKTEKLKN